MGDNDYTRPLGSMLELLCSGLSALQIQVGLSVSILFCVVVPRLRRKEPVDAVTHARTSADGTSSLRMLGRRFYLTATPPTNNWKHR